MKIRLAVAALMGVAVAVMSVGVASAVEDYPPNAPIVQLLVSSAPCDSNVGANGNNWQPGSTVTLTLHSTPVNVGTASVNAVGTFSTSFVVPKGTELGNHVLEATG